MVEADRGRICLPTPSCSNQDHIESKGIFSSFNPTLQIWKCLLLITLRITPKGWWTHSQMHTNTQKKRRIRKNERNVLKPLKTHLQPSRGRNECLDVYRNALGVPIYMLTRRKCQNTTLRLLCTIVPLSALRGAHLSGCHSTRQDGRACSHMCTWGPPKNLTINVMRARSTGATVTVKPPASSTNWCSSPCATTRQRAPDWQVLQYPPRDMTLTHACQYMPWGAISAGAIVPTKCAPCVRVGCSPLCVMVVSHAPAMHENGKPLPPKRPYITKACE